MIVDAVREVRPQIVGLERRVMLGKRCASGITSEDMPEPPQRSWSSITRARWVVPHVPARARGCSSVCFSPK